MDFKLSEEQQAFQQAARQFAADHMAPHAAQWDKESLFPAETLRRAADLGFAALCIGDDVGGCGLTKLDSALVFEELATACPSTAALISVHNMASWIIDSFGDNEQRQRFLPKLTSMSQMASYCLTEPGAGSDAASLKTRAVLDDGHYILTGTKAFISGGGASDIYTVMARTGDDGPDGVSCIVVEKGTRGLEFGAPEDKLGWHSQPTAMVHFDGCRVPESNLIGGLGNGFRIAMSALNGGRLNIAACSIGGARQCLEQACAYVQERKQFGRPLSALQSIQFRLADMATKLEAARLMLHKAACKLEAGDADAPRYCAMAKQLATDNGFEIVNAALQLHGGYGYLRDYGIERYLRDLRVHQILEGTNEIMRLIVARDLLKA